MGKICFVKWPYLTEGRVWSISDGEYTYYDEKEKYGGGKGSSKPLVSRRPLYPEEKKLWNDSVTEIKRK